MHKNTNMKTNDINSKIKAVTTHQATQAEDIRHARQPNTDRRKMQAAQCFTSVR